ncbi:hypothetical protein BN13_2060001 [Nostocoides jenkinsii Ben 74]|uniref:Transposase n=1 Tax=Nostocoides jenkinsii Ben 74 TaxID=1193518 RepID=A0A077MA97_9MICO|nr:hypothetical protein BN13_2060001 [Tetrasphaera jenkinsii Ben 74]
MPHTFTCALLGVSLAWFYKWVGRANGPAASSGLHTDRDRRRDTIDRAVAVMFRKVSRCARFSAVTRRSGRGRVDGE